MLAECAFDTRGIGCEVDLVESGSVPATLFGESASRVVVSVAPANRSALIEKAAAAGVPARLIGRVGGNRLILRVGGHDAIDCTVAQAEQVWSTSIERHFDARVA